MKAFIKSLIRNNISKTEESRRTRWGFALLLVFSAFSMWLLHVMLGSSITTATSAMVILKFLFMTIAFGAGSGALASIPLWIGKYDKYISTNGTVFFVLIGILLQFAPFGFR